MSKIYKITFFVGLFSIFICNNNTELEGIFFIFPYEKSNRYTILLLFSPFHFATRSTKETWKGSPRRRRSGLSSGNRGDKHLVHLNMHAKNRTSLPLWFAMLWRAPLQVNITSPARMMAVRPLSVTSASPSKM